MIPSVIIAGKYFEQGYKVLLLTHSPWVDVFRISKEGQAVGQTIVVRQTSADFTDAMDWPQGMNVPIAAKAKWDAAEKKPHTDLLGQQAAHALGDDETGPGEAGVASRQHRIER